MQQSQTFSLDELKALSEKHENRMSVNVKRLRHNTRGDPKVPGQGRYLNF